MNLLSTKLSFSFDNTSIQNYSPLNNYICLSYLRLIISRTSKLKAVWVIKVHFARFYSILKMQKQLINTDINHCMLWVINSEMSVMLTSIQHISRQELLLIVEVFFLLEKKYFRISSFKPHLVSCPNNYLCLLPRFASYGYYKRINCYEGIMKLFGPNL